jgi:hypothetical protein
MAAVLRDRPGVPIAALGTWMTATGEWQVTHDQLRDAVVAQHDPAFRRPVLKLGHLDSRFTDGQMLGDGQPAVGRLENLRLSADGSQLLADLVGIPAWLDDVLDSAYPSRSIEALTGVETAAGAHYAMVVTGLALLGETTPAIETLGDLADLFGVPRSVEAYTAAATVAASALPPTPVEAAMPARALGQVVASASIDELIRAAEDWAETQDSLGDCWVRDVGTDWVVFTVWLPGGDTRLYQCSWSESDGGFTFGAPVRVRPTYEPVPEASPAAVAASALPGVAHDVSMSRLRRESPEALRSARGRDVTASEHPSGVHVPISPALAAELGVPEDADDATVLEAIATIRATATTEPAATLQNQEGGTTDTSPAPTADVEALVAAATARIEQKYGSVIASQSAELATIKAEKAKETKDGIIGAAIAAGKIKPADRAAWEKDYDDAPGVVASLLGRIEPGTAIPLTAAGHNGGEVDGLDDEAKALHDDYRRMLAGGAL